MKKYFNIKTIFLAICIIIIIAGAITIGVSGFEKSLEYKAGTRIEVYIPQGYEKQEVMDIARECFKTEEILFSKIENVNKVAGIKVTEYTEAQLENYLFKIAEKYEIDAEEMEYYEIVVPETKIGTLINPYILPVVLITVLLLIYVIIKNYKSNNKIKMSLKVLGILVITLGLYFSIIALFKLPFSMYTMPFAFGIYIVTLLISANKKCE